LKKNIPALFESLKKKALILEGNKRYGTYKEALVSCTPDAYQDVELCNLIADKTVIYSVGLLAEPYVLNPTNVFLSAAINKYLNDSSQKSMNILDFGGACGAHYFEMKRFISKEVTLKWYVLETSQMVRSARNKGLNNEELFFISSIDEIGDKIDFIHSSCALQYVDDPYGIARRLLNIRADQVFFNRMMFNEYDNEFVTVQKSFLSSNGPGFFPEGYRDRIISYPHTTLSLKKFNSMISDNGYQVKWIFDEKSGSFKIRNERVVGKGLLCILKP
jgi:putative methyltransferase (TIGR04325 family)